MAHDHSISRFLTDAWQTKPRRLHHYDFATGTFDEEGPASEEAEKVLSALVESPAGAYRAEILRGDASGNASGDWKVYRALVAMIWLQTAHDPHSRIDIPSDAPFTLDGLCAQQEKLLDLMGKMSVERFPLIGVTIPPAAAPLFFTEAAYFPIPMVAAPPILAVPLTPRHFIATPEKGFSAEGLTQWLSHPVALSAFSVAVASVNRVVIPPELIGTETETSNANPLGLQRMLHEQRTNAEGLFELVAEASRLVAFRASTP